MNITLNNFETKTTKELDKFHTENCAGIWEDKSEELIELLVAIEFEMQERGVPGYQYS